jgi:transcriptional regulator with XRE-family HTH domain
VSKRLTRETVAKRAGMTPTTYGKIEKGRHTQTRKLQDIADVFGVAIDDVLLISPLQDLEMSRMTTDFSATNPRSPRGENRVIPPATPTATATTDSELRELWMQVRVLQEQIAEIAADRNDDHSKRGPTPRVRKSVRPASPRKSR